MSCVYVVQTVAAFREEFSSEFYGKKRDCCKYIFKELFRTEICSITIVFENFLKN